VNVFTGNALSAEGADARAAPVEKRELADPRRIGR